MLLLALFAVPLTIRVCVREGGAKMENMCGCEEVLVLYVCVCELCRKVWVWVWVCGIRGPRSSNFLCTPPNFISKCVFIHIYINLYINTYIHISIYIHTRVGCTKTFCTQTFCALLRTLYSNMYLYIFISICI